MPGEENIVDTRFFFSAEGNYLGGFSGEEAVALVPEDAIEVAEPPNDARDTLGGLGQIVPYTEPVSLIDRLSAMVDQLSIDQQIQLGGLISLVYINLQAGKLDKARELVSGASLPEELNPVQQQILMELSR